MNLLDLPNELLLHIIKYLEIWDYDQLSCTCQQIYQLLSQNETKDWYIRKRIAKTEINIQIQTQVQRMDEIWFGCCFVPVGPNLDIDLFWEILSKKHQGNVKKKMRPVLIHWRHLNWNDQLEPIMIWQQNLEILEQRVQRLHLTRDQNTTLWQVDLYIYDFTGRQIKELKQILIPANHQAQIDSLKRLIDDNQGELEKASEFTFEMGMKREKFQIVRIIEKNYRVFLAGWADKHHFIYQNGRKLTLDITTGTESTKAQMELDGKVIQKKINFR